MFRFRPRWTLALACCLLAGCAGSKRGEVTPTEPIAPAGAEPVDLSEALERAAADELDPAPPEIRALALRAEDQRVVSPELIGALKHEHPEARALAVRAIGRIGSAEHGVLLLPTLADPAEIVRAEAAFAIAGYGSSSAVSALEKLLDDPSLLVRIRVAAGLGLLADEPSARGPMLRALQDEDPRVQMIAGHSVTRYRSDLDFAIDPLIALTARPEPPIARAAFDALGRISSKTRTLEPADRRRVRDHLLAHATSPDPLVRAAVAYGLMLPQGEREAAPLGNLALDPDPRVQVAAIRSFSFPGAPVEPFLSQTLRDEDDVVVLATVRGLGRMRGDPVIQALSNLLVHDETNWLRERAVAALRGSSRIAGAKIANGLSRDDSAGIRKRTASLVVDREEELSQEIASRLLQDPDPQVRAAAIPALATRAEPLADSCAEFAASPDAETRAGVVAAARSRLTSPAADDATRKDALDVLARAWRSSPKNEDPWVRRLILDAAALGAKTSAAPQARQLLDAALQDPDYSIRRDAVAALRSEYDLSVTTGPAAEHPVEHYEEILRWAETPKAAIVTIEREGFTPGRFTVLLDTFNAPLTSWNFAQLAASGFFVGSPVHRLVPNFVVQMGDPLGNGSGGPGYTIRDELSARPLVAGTLAMASRGKDTAGSQFFVTLTDQPHLLGEYTVFGSVVRNMDGVVRLLLPEDRIVAVEVYDGDGSEPLPPL
ncbi:MAG: hypothetical protein GY716_12225 [bacterium]|nr:hypothetical protein [bacterium]